MSTHLVPWPDFEIELFQYKFIEDALAILLGTGTALLKLRQCFRLQFTHLEIGLKSLAWLLWD